LTAGEISFSNMGHPIMRETKDILVLSVLLVDAGWE
jgi:hypothetical protein